PLYQQFRLDEPWDSPNNIRLLSRMPKVYQHPLDEAAKAAHATCYQVFDGPQVGGINPPFVSDPKMGLRPFPLVGAPGPVPVFEGGLTTRMPASFPDGTSNTILVAEAGEAIPWSKPGDLRYDPNGPLPKLGGLFRG